MHANGYNVPPDKTNKEGYNDPTATFRGPFTNPIPSWYFRSTLELYRDTVQNQKPLCITEFGWGSSEGFGYTPPSYEFVNDNTLQEQGDYIVQAFDLMKAWGYVKMAFLFNLDYAQKSPNGVQDRTAPWSIFDQTGAARPAFEQSLPGVDDVVITATGQKLVPWPEGSRYPGFIFAHGAAPADVELALRAAHRQLEWELEPLD